MEIRIIAMTARNGGEEIAVRVEMRTEARSGEYLSETRELVLLTDSYMTLRPSRGYIDRDYFSSLEEAAELCTAVHYGMRILSFGANTKRTLTEKICRHGCRKDVAAEAVDFLVRRGYLSEAEDAVREAERGVRKLYGKSRILSAIYAKGYDSESIRAATEYLDTVDFARNCAELLAKRFGVLPTEPDSRRKAVASLIRSGYAMREIKEAEWICRENAGSDPDSVYRVQSGNR